MLNIGSYGYDLRQDGMMYLIRPFGGARHRSEGSLNRSVAHGYNRYNRKLDRVISSFSFFLFSEAEDRGKGVKYMYGIFEIV